MKPLFANWRNFLKEGKSMDTKQVVKVVLYKDNKVLLVKSAHGEFKNQWDLPGGHVQENESIIDALKREVKEETNLELIQIETLNYSHNNKKFYKSKLPKGKIKLSSEHNKHALFTSEQTKNINNIASYFVRAIIKTFQDSK
jgi:8-oxo-dGTP pyrophosphatase MutT (NUDIX family)